MKIIFIGLILFASVSVGDCYSTHYPGNKLVLPPEEPGESETITTPKKVELSEIEELRQLKRSVERKYQSPLTMIDICKVSNGVLFDIDIHETDKEREEMVKRVKAALSGEDPGYRDESDYIKLKESEYYEGRHVLLIREPEKSGEEMYTVLDAREKKLPFDIIRPFSKEVLGELVPHFVVEKENGRRVIKKRGEK